ncbi:MAG: BatA domain-containing protein [Planctomycetaceae bacterium]|nr:BatA domain-containing protein [Planctomycetaceae bacterium]
MTFLSIGFLACGLAAAIPVFIHMIHRQNLRELPFATLRFIRISEQKTRNKRRIQDLFLLLIRMAVLLLIAIGLANPAVRNLSNLWGGAKTSAVIILDNSASMAAIDGTAARIDTAVTSAEKILDELGRGDNVAVIVPCGPTFPENGQLFSSQDKVRKVLRDVKVSYETANLAAAVQKARVLLEKAVTPSKLIFVVSDQQTVSWQGVSVAQSSPQAGDSPDANIPEEQQPEASADAGHDLSGKQIKEMLQIPLILVNCHQTPKPNVGLVRLDTRNVLPIAQVPVTMNVELKNESKLEQTRRIEVFLNSIKQYSSEDIKIPPDGHQSSSFTVIFDRGGLHRGEVRLVGTDGNPLDDKLFFAMEVDQGIPVAIIRPKKHDIPFLEATFYLERALQTGAGGVSPIRLTVFDKEHLLTEPLQNYAVVIAVDIPAPERDAAERLVQYVERGGNLIWTCGDNIYADEYNQLNEEFGGKLLPAPILSMQAPDVDSGTDAWNIGTMDGSYAPFRNLVNPRELFTSVLVYRRIPIDISKGPVSALASLNDDMPLIIQKRIPGVSGSRSTGGTVTFVGTGVHYAWTNLPTRPIFVPLMNQLIFQLAGVEQTRLQTVAGVPLSYAFKEGEQPAAVEIIPPSGAILRRELKKNANNSINPLFVFDDTYAVGVYQIRPLETVKQTVIPFSVNINSNELDNIFLTEEDCKTRFGSTPVVFSNAGESMDTTFAQLKSGTGLWDVFLWAVLLVLVFEAFVSNRLTQRNEDKEKGVDVRHLLPRKTTPLA